MRNRIIKLERVNKVFFRVRYDSDFIIISDYSVFEEIFFMNYLRKKFIFVINLLNDLLDNILIFIFLYLITIDFCRVFGVC